MNRKLSVLAVFIYTQTGWAQFKCVKGDCYSGYGEAVFNSGAVYSGNFAKGKPHGFGTMTFAEGHRYAGNWVNQQREGAGKFKFASGHEYVGNFLHNQFSGKGVMTYANGNKYEGEWSANQPEGYGVMTTYSGDRYAGFFSKGYFEGVGTMWYANGTRYEGEWKAGKREGVGTLVHPDGRQEKGVWSQNNFAGAPLMAGNPSPNSSTKTDADKGANPVKIWAVLVGVARYTHFSPLNYTDDDAYRLQIHLRSPEGGALPESQVFSLIDEEARRDAIVQALVAAANSADENDVLMFYFSGHGQEGAFLPVDSDGYTNRLDHAQVRDILLKSRAKSKIILADACHSGSLFVYKTPSSEAMEKLYAAFAASKGGLAVLLSSRSDEYSLEDNKMRSGVFSYFLMKGARGLADVDGNGIITVRELHAYLHANVRTYTAGAQTPLLFGNFDPAMPFAVIR
ncbi:MAG: hypothetical protein RL181_29 [Bacteroidota bacterium]